MTATAIRKPRTASSQTATVSAQNVKDLLAELAYRLHATKVIGRVSHDHDRGFGARPAQPR
jgi:hypothetical protein